MFSDPVCACRFAVFAVASIGQLVGELVTGQGPIEQIVAGHISPFVSDIFTRRCCVFAWKLADGLG